MSNSRFVIGDGNAAMNLVYGALLSAYVGLNLGSLPGDLTFWQLGLWFTAMFWAAFLIGFCSRAIELKRWKALFGLALMLALNVNYVVMSASQLGLSIKIIGAIYYSWILVMITIQIMVYVVGLRLSQND